jgi:hypothetical protein
MDMALFRMLRRAMDREYELFERRPDGILNWRGVVIGEAAARVRVRLLSVETDNECFAVRTADRTVVARVAAHDRAAEAA